MIICKTRAELELFLQKNPADYAFVPTMGNLHVGHLSLVDTAKRYSGRVIVSIFVNPTQFAPDEDFERYPRTLNKDLTLLSTKNVDAVYIPRTQDIYPQKCNITFDIPHLTQCLCGKSRPHFFNGVMTVLLKLYLQILPKYIILGEKDYQQYLVVAEMVKSIGFNTMVVASPLVRNVSGLALSSRNNLLCSADLKRAELINKILKDSALLTPQHAVEYACKHLKPIVDKIDYIEVRSETDLMPYQERSNKTYRLFFAGFVSNVRLIDNIPMK